jgi:hypothetical protein
VETLVRPDLAPPEAVALLTARAEAARAWTPQRGVFDDHLEGCLAESPEPIGDAPPSPEECSAAWQALAECVPPGHPLPPPPGTAPDPGGDVAPVRRWLAARAFASWVAFQGEGLRTTVRALRLALAVLGAERSRPGPRGERRSSPAALLEAFRRADLLLVHLADPEALARRLSRCEAEAEPITSAW